MQHEHNHTSMESRPLYGEYLKFAAVMVFVTVASFAVTMAKNITVTEYAESFMGVFFLVFGSFKLLKLREFAYGFQSYDILAKRSLAYSYSYPFIQIVFGVMYLLSLVFWWLNGIVLIISLVSAVGVIKSLQSKNKVHCVCLGNVIKLPLSTISFVEDFGMALMALFMLTT